jgi:hypothetical protein
MLRQDLPSKTLRFGVRKGPLVTTAIVTAVFGPATLWLAFHLATNPNVQFHGRGALLMNMLPNPARVGLFAVLGVWMVVAAWAYAARALSVLGELVIRADGILFESGVGTWTTPWRNVRSVKILNKKVAVIERDQPAAPGSWYVRMWRQMRYGCDPDNTRLVLVRMAAADGKPISPEDLVKIIENYRQGAMANAAGQTRAA